jgi:hypothetical protein
MIRQWIKTFKSMLLCSGLIKCRITFKIENIAVICTCYLCEWNASECIFIWNFICVLLLGSPLLWMRLNRNKLEGNDRGLCDQLGKI